MEPHDAIRRQSLDSRIPRATAIVAVDEEEPVHAVHGIVLDVAGIRDQIAIEPGRKVDRDRLEGIIARREAMLLARHDARHLGVPGRSGDESSSRRELVTRHEESRGSAVARDVEDGGAVVVAGFGTDLPAGPSDPHPGIRMPRRGARRELDASFSFLYTEIARELERRLDQTFRKPLLELLAEGRASGFRSVRGSERRPQPLEQQGTSPIHPNHFLELLHGEGHLALALEPAPFEVRRELLLPPGL